MSTSTMGQGRRQDVSRPAAQTSPFERRRFRKIRQEKGRCAYGPRQPLMVISPFAKANFVDDTLTDQRSVLRFIEDYWKTGLIGGGSFDQLAGSLMNKETPDFAAVLLIYKSPSV
jgi:hypothetical protein